MVIAGTTPFAPTRVYRYLKTTGGAINPAILADITAGTLVTGTAVHTAAYYQGSDGGGGDYTVVAAGSGTDDGGSYITAGTVQLKGIFNGSCSLRQFGAVDGTDATTIIQTFLDYVLNTNVGVAILDGSYLVSARIRWGRSTALPLPLTTRFDGALILTATTAIDVMLDVQNYPFGTLHHRGSIYLKGTGSSDYTTRTRGVAMRLSAAAGAHFHNVSCQSFYYDGVQLTDIHGNCNMVSFDIIGGGQLGSGGPTAGQSLTANWSSPTNSGTPNSTSQTTTLTVSANMPTFPDYEFNPNTCVINGETYYINSRSPGQIVIYPWLNPTAGSSGTLTYVFGSALKMTGGDGGEASAGVILAQNCGIGVSSTALYGADFARLVIEYCGAAVQIGANPSSAHVHDKISSLYCEGNTVDILQVTNTSSPLGVQITGYAIDPSKIDGFRPRDNSGDRLPIPSQLYFEGLGYFGHTALPKVPLKKSDNFAGSLVGVDLTDTPYPTAYLAQGDLTIAVATPDLDLNRLFGNDSQAVTVFGTGTNHRPPGTITVTPPSGWTVNGASTAVFSGFAGPATILLFMEFATTNIRAANLGVPMVVTPTVTGDGSTTAFTVTHNLALASPYIPSSITVLGPSGALLATSAYTIDTLATNSFRCTFASAPANAAVTKFKITA